MALRVLSLAKGTKTYLKGLSKGNRLKTWMTVAKALKETRVSRKTEVLSVALNQ
jgi:hypothetical protein